MPSKEEQLEFSTYIENLALDEALGFMDAICHYCKETGLEIEVAATLINAPLKSKIKIEAEELNLLKKTSRLPI
jgi:hypothetical protein